MTPVVSTHYKIGESPLLALDAYVRWEAAPAFHYIYPALQFGFERPRGGYIGTQLVGSRKTAIFSIWDSADGAADAIPRSESAVRFSHEGSGVMCIPSFEWELGREYQITVRRTVRYENEDRWAGSIRDTVTRELFQIGEIGLRGTESAPGRGLLSPGCITFLEYFAIDPPLPPYSRVVWRGPYSRGVIPMEATSGSNLRPLSKASGRGYPVVVHEAGDGVERGTTGGSLLWARPRP